MNKKKAARAHKARVASHLNSREHLLVYTDGLLKKIHGFRRVGSGTALYHQNVEVKSEMLGLGGRSEVYDSEMAALAMGARAAIQYTTQNPQITNIHFFADNTAAVQRIFDPTPRAAQRHSGEFHNIISAFLDQNRDHSVEHIYSTC